ncbi:MAG: OmpA family protein [Myxococcota bacterium]
MIWLALSLFSSAQNDGFDARGRIVAASDIDLRDPIVAWRPEAQRPGSVAIQALLEYADDPLVIYTLDQESQRRDVLLDNVFGANLMGHYAPHERIAITATVPVWFTSRGVDGPQGVGAGDLRLSVPIGLAMPDEYSGGFGLSVVPFIDAPTGTRTAFLGNNGVSWGGLAAIGMSGKTWEIDGNLGYRSTPDVTYEDTADLQWDNVRGGDQILTALAGSVHLNRNHALRLEGLHRAALADTNVPNSQSPAELLLSARGRYKQGLSWTAGAGTGLNGAAGAAKLRLFAGMGYVIGKPPASPEVAWLRVDVVSASGEPISGALVEADLDEAETGKNGSVGFDDVEIGKPMRVVAEAPGFSKDSAVLDIVQGENVARVVLSPSPGMLRVIVKDSNGEPVDALVELTGPKPADGGQIGDDGIESYKVPPGQWSVIATAPDLPVGEGMANVPVGGKGVIEIVLQRPEVEITKNEIVTLDNVNFIFDTATLVPESEAIVAEVARVLAAHPEFQLIEVAGHTDVRGSADYNRALSQRRVETVKRYLMSKGVAAERLVPKGYGESKPLKSGDSEEDHASNRRVQFVILKRSDEGEGTP